MLNAVRGAKRPNEKKEDVEVAKKPRGGKAPKAKAKGKAAVVATGENAKDETPKDADQTPKDQTPKDETPKDETPNDEPPSAANPSKKTSSYRSIDFDECLGGEGQILSDANRLQKLWGFFIYKFSCWKPIFNQATQVSFKFSTPQVFLFTTKVLIPKCYFTLVWVDQRQEPLLRAGEVIIPEGFEPKSKSYTLYPNGTGSGIQVLSGGQDVCISCSFKF